MKTLLAVVTAGATLFANFDSVKFEGEETVNGRVLQGVRFNLRDFDTDVRAYFEQASGRLVREEMMFGKRLEIYSYDDYRTVNGILEPYTIRMKRGNDEYEIKVEKIIYNQSLPLTKFEIPAGSYANLPALPDVIAKARANQQKLLSNYHQFTYERYYEFTESSCTENSITGMQDCESFDRKQRFDVMFHRAYPMLIITYDDRYNIRRKGLTHAEARQKRIAEARSKVDSLANSKPNDGLKKLDGAWGRDVMAVLQFAQFSNLRPATREGRDCWALDFFPAPEREYNEDNFVKQVAGTIHIDVQTNFVAHLTVHDTEKVQNQRVPVIAYTIAHRTQAPVCDGFWLPTKAAGPLRRAILGGERFDAIEYSKYHFNGQPLNCNAPTTSPK